jgi:predicted nuclease with TOPRIM domain
MRERLEARLAELDAEVEKGRARLRELETEQAQVQEVLLRILGAKQVLEELLADEATAADNHDRAVEHRVADQTPSEESRAEARP